jgi:lipoprotein-releasing system ATP-binding protein
MNETPLLEIRNVTKLFKLKEERLEILRGIDLRVFKGETIAIIGASGVGKSTFLHILATLERPSQGSVFYKGEDLFALCPKLLAKFRNQRLGFIFQFHHLLPEFSALENVMLPALIAGWSKKKAQMQAKGILALVELSQRERHRPGELSGGEQQRVAIARALVLGPELILADEPTGDLDETTAKKVQDLLISLAIKMKITMFVATHNLRFASLFSKQYELQGGHLRRKRFL